MKKFLTSNTTYMRLARTIVQGILGVIIANLDAIVGGFTIEPTAKALIVAIVMAILSPIMGAISDNDKENA